MDPSSEIKQFGAPWYASLENPKAPQEKLFRSLISKYATTEYGNRYGASTVSPVDDFRQHFPIVSYQDLVMELELVSQGNFAALLSEPPLE